MVISDFKVFIVFVALGLLSHRSICLLGGGGGGGATGFQFKLLTMQKATLTPTRVFGNSSDGILLAGAMGVTGSLDA